MVFKKCIHHFTAACISTDPARENGFLASACQMIIGTMGCNNSAPFPEVTAMSVAWKESQFRGEKVPHSCRPNSYLAENFVQNKLSSCNLITL